MSSLKAQLAQVAQSNATVALDRKRRQKLHSTSLIYNPKTAATQDYENIFEDAVEAFNTLVTLDSRFKVFSTSLFSESSVSIDRNVQTKEKVRDLDNAVNSYLMLVSSRWHLAPALYATEWLVRRFQIHIHNVEMLLLSTLNYYHTPVFKRILNIVKLPPLFAPFSNFVKSESNATDLTIVRLFNNLEFLKLYSNYLSISTKQKVTYTNQLLFATCSLINVIAYNASDEEKLNEFVPLFLELAAKLLESELSDSQIAAHTILAVFASAFPLKRAIILAATETILATLKDDVSKRSALLTICKLFQTLKGQGNVEHLSAKLYQMFSATFSFDYLLNFANENKSKTIDKFFTCYVRAIARYDHEKLGSIVKILSTLNFEKYEQRLIIIDLLHLSEILEDKSQLIGIFEYLISVNENLVLNSLQALNITAELFEIRLTTALFSTVEGTNVNEDITKELQTSKVDGSSPSIPSFKEFMTNNSEFIYTKAESVLAVDDSKFNKLLSLFVEAVGKKYQPGLFLSSFFTTLESRITFVLRIIVSPSSPVALRLISLTQLGKFIHSIDEKSDVFSLVPILVLALTDISKSVRSNARKVLYQIHKRPASPHYFLSDRLYGENINVPMLSPKDSRVWLSKFLEDYILENSDISSLLIPSKNEKIYLLFWCNQALHIPLAHPKMILMKNLTTLSCYTSTYSQIFEHFVSNYSKTRELWESRCKTNKVSFVLFEESVCSLIALKEKNGFAINFVIEALQSEHEQLATTMAARLLGTYETFKFAHQLKIVKSIVDSITDKEINYDCVDLLQSLPLTTDIFVSLFKENRINEERGEKFAKKRRRRSSTASKTALQKEDVSQMAEVYLKKITVLLETLDKHTLPGSEPLLNCLFALLSDLEILDQDGGLPVLYAQETLSSCMVNAIESLKLKKDVKLPSIRADILVAAIRTSTSPQVQNKLLSVIASLAVLSPEIILHSVMPIFTFMGAHTIRQDDEFSTLVVEKTISTIIPALLNSSSPENKMHEIEFLLMSFSTAFPHVPKHRRVRLFTTLVKELGAFESIAPFLFLISLQYSNNLKKFRIADAKTYVEFFKAFLGKFSVVEKLVGLEKFFDLIMLLTPNESNKEKWVSKVLFSNSIINMSEMELFELRKNSIMFVDKVMNENESDHHSSEDSFKVNILGTLLDPTTPTSMKTSVMSKFSQVLEKTIQFINTADSSCHQLVAIPENDLEFDINDYKQILFSLLSNVLDLLPISYFVESILPFLKSNSPEPIKHHLTLVLTDKFNSEPTESCETTELVIKSLLETLTDNTETVPILQVSLNSLAALINKFGDKINNSLLMEALNVGLSHFQAGRTELFISSSAVLTNLVQTLGVKTLAFYPKIMPIAISTFNEHKEKDDPLKEQLQLSILLLFASMTKRLPAFLVSNLADVFRILFYSECTSDSIRLSLVNVIVEHIDAKEILKTLNKIWLSDVSRTNDSVSVSLFLSMLESTVEKIDKKSATQNSPVFFKLLLNLFEYRAISVFDNNTISRIESSVHQISNIYVLKLNDKIFRPLFALVVKWAFDGEGVTNFEVSRTQRLVAFFSFFNKVQENLKSIITSYFTYLLEQTNILLTQFASGELQDSTLRRLILISLTSSFKYDRDEYWKSTSRFELISACLINQLVNIEDTIGKYLVKAIGALATNNSNVEEHNKTLSKLMISHMKTTCQLREKFWAVRSMKLIYSKVGDNWLVLLPQLVPVIAELLEDEDEDVEYEVRSGLVKVVENVLGEPFDKYLN